MTIPGVQGYLVDEFGNRRPITAGYRNLNGVRRPITRLTIKDRPTDPTDPTDPDPPVDPEEPPPPPPPPPPEGAVRIIPDEFGHLAVYPSGEDQNTFNWFDNWGSAGQTYYQPNQHINLTKERTRMNRKQSPNITWTLKGTQLMAQIANDQAQGLDRLDEYVDELRVLSEHDPDVPVFAALEHEARVKVRFGVENPATGLTGESARPEIIGQAMRRFFQRCHADAPRVLTSYWIVGSDREFEATVGRQFGTHRNRIHMWDPYARSAGLTLASITKADMDWFRAQPFDYGQPFYIAETGMPVANGDAAMGRFFTNFHTQAATLGIWVTTLFDSPKDNNHKITVGTVANPTYPQAVAAFKASMNKAPKGPLSYTTVEAK
jgi:hypothetical protein